MTTTLDADQLECLLVALALAKDVEAAARMDLREAQADEAKASLSKLMAEREHKAAQCEVCECQQALDKHIAQITMSHLEDEPEGC